MLHPSYNSWMFAILRLRPRIGPGLVLIASLLSTSIADAQVRQVRRFSFAPKQEARSLFDLSGNFEQQALALTSQGEFLNFSSQGDGIWQIYRIRNWSEEKPLIDHLPLPGYFSSRDRHDLERMDINVYVTSDSAYAVCVGTAEWLKRAGGKTVGKAKMASIITVIDLKTFRIVNSKTRTPSEAFEFQAVSMDQHGQMLVRSSAFGEKRHGELVQLDVPSLTEGQTCAYEYLVDR